MHLEARIIRILLAKNCEYWVQVSSSYRRFFSETWCTFKSEMQKPAVRWWRSWNCDI